MHYNIKMSKYTFCILIICITFAGIVMQAYTYLPSGNKHYENISELINNETITPQTNNNKEITKENYKEENNEISDNDEDDLENIEEKSQNSQEYDRRNHKLNLEPLETELDKKAQNNNDIEQLLKNANELKNQEKFQEALSIYKTAHSDSTDEETKAFCLEQISTIYAIERRYGTALSYAQRAYNTIPSTSREVLLARLYYKVGNIEKANSRMENILKRDFEQDK